MTATPDKRDDNLEGRNIYEIFDHNIAYEIRLQQAMEENLLCPFHYFGYSGSRVKGLIFCSRVDEAQELSEKFNACGLKTVALSGADSEEKRTKSIELLTREVSTESPQENEYGAIIYEGEEYLDYIITVDIFSEGTDIVEVNQVIMLRPTQSPFRLYLFSN